LHELADEHYLTVQEAADLLRVAKTTIYRWIEGGKIEGKKISRKKILIPEESIRTLLHGEEKEDGSCS